MTVDVPSWVAAVVAAVLGFVGAWAALRATVATLTKDVGELKSLLLTVTTIQAAQRALESELDRVRETGHQVRNALMVVSERVARLEAHKGDNA